MENHGTRSTNDNKNNEPQEWLDCNNINIEQYINTVHTKLTVAKPNNDYWADVEVEAETSTNTSEVIEISDGDGIKEETSLIVPSAAKSGKFKCKKCSYSTDWGTNLTKHVYNRHTSEEGINWVECAKCDYRSKTKDALKKHLYQVHEECVTWQSCPYCPFKSKLKTPMHNHIIARHTEEDKINWFKCDSCDFKTKFTVCLRRHEQRSHLGKKKLFKCDCGHSTRHRQSLKRHKMEVHGIVFPTQEMKCDQCEFVARSNVGLSLHLSSVHSTIIAVKGKTRLESLEKEKILKEIPVVIDGQVTYRKILVDPGSNLHSASPPSSTSTTEIKKRKPRGKSNPKPKKMPQGVEENLASKEIPVLIDGKVAYKKVVIKPKPDLKSS